MSPADRETLLKKLEYLHGTLEELFETRGMSEEAFVGDRLLQDATARRLQLAIESVTDCSRLLVTLEGWRRVREEADAVLILAREGVIANELAQRLLEAKRFRNVLVHLYVDVDPALVYRNLQEGYRDLEGFATSLATWLKSA